MKPGNFILDLLRTYGQRGTSARNIMKAAAMFAFSDNAIRVTLSRLAARGLIENVRRGHYRLAAGSDPVNDFVEEWRLGEARRRAWSGEFLTVHLQEEAGKPCWALHATGFRQLGEHYWARPDNLRRSGGDLAAWLATLSVPDTAILAEGCRIDPAVQDRLRDLYRTEDLQVEYRRLNQQLQSSAESLAGKPRTLAMKESFALGGKVLQLLAKDPYLPEEWLPADDRAALWQSMINYDQLGRSIWAGDPNRLPAQTMHASYA